MDQVSVIVWNTWDTVKHGMQGWSKSAGCP